MSVWPPIDYWVAFIAIKKTIAAKIKSLPIFSEGFLFAEREGFEPPVPLGTAVFKTAVIDHSTISPKGGAKIRYFSCFSKFLSSVRRFFHNCHELNEFCQIT